MYSITVSISGQHITVMQNELVADSLDYLTAQVYVSEDWTGADVWLHLQQGTTHYAIEVVDGVVGTDRHLNLGAGVWNVWCVGEKSQDGSITQRITTGVGKISVAASGVQGGSPLPEIPASAAEQILATANDAKAIARGVRVDAEAGAFDGATGPAGQDGSDADVTADNLNAALSTATDAQKTAARENIGAAKAEGEYQLIEAITLTDDIYSVERTEEPDGTPYNFSRMLISIETSPGSGPGMLNVRPRCGNTSLYGVCITNGISTGKRYTQAETFQQNGIWIQTALTAGGLWGSGVSRFLKMTYTTVSSAPQIDNLIIYSTTSGVDIPAGTVIYIFGVRA